MVRPALRYLRYPLYLLAGVLAFAIAYVGATYIGAAIPAYSTVDRAEAAAVAMPDEPSRIYLLTTLLHADFAIPVDDSVRDRFAFLRDIGVPLDNPALKYLVFGWGSRAFYINTPTYADLRPGPVLRAITGDISVMHVVPAAEVSNLPGATPLELPKGGLGKLLDYIQSSFDKGKDASLPGYGSADLFYAAKGDFNIFTPCNIWVAKGLRSAGLATGAWTPTTHSLLLGLSWHAGEAIGR